MKRILVVDDELPVRDLISLTLSLRDWDVTGVSSGTEALARLAAERFDLVLLDIYLPDLDGVRVLMEMRRARIAVPVVLISGSAHKDMEREAAGLDCFGYLPKPVSASQLRIVASRVLENA